VPVYLSDCAALFGHTDWRPRRSAEQTLRDIHAWICSDVERIAKALGFERSSR
jgi:hypothetical protein